MQRVRTVVAAMFMAAFFGCGGGNPAGPEEKGEVRITISGPVSLTQAPESWPRVPIAVNPTAYHTKGKAVTFSACTIGGQAVGCKDPVYVLPGTHEKCATGQSDDGAVDTACLPVTVNRLEKEITFTVVSETGGRVDASGITFYVGEGLAMEEHVTGINGSKVVNSRYVEMSNAPIWVPGTADRMPWLGRTSPEFWERPAIVLIPRHVEVPESPGFVAERVAVNLEEATKLASEPSASGPSSFIRRLANRPDQPRAEDVREGEPVGLPVGSWPNPKNIRTAFNSAVSPADSVRMWLAIESCVRRFGGQIRFVPAGKEDVVTGGVLLHLTPDYNSGSVAEVFEGDYVSGAIGVDPNRSDDLFFPLVCHEIGHVLGRGHTEAPSIMRPSSHPGMTIQAKDVGLILLVQWIREAERESNSRFSLTQSYQGERRENGDLETPVIYITEDGSYGTVSNPDGPVSIIASKKN